MERQATKLRSVQIGAHLRIGKSEGCIGNEYWTDGSANATVLVRGRQNEALAIRTPAYEDQTNDVSREKGEGKYTGEGPLALE